MTPQEREELFDTMNQEERKLLSSKGADYSSVGDCLSNFKLNAERLGLGKYQVWAIYCMKHLDSIFNAIKKTPMSPYASLKSESIHTRINDARNYLGLLECLLVEDLVQADSHKAIPVDCIDCYPICVVPRGMTICPCDHHLK